MKQKSVLKTLLKIFAVIAAVVTLGGAIAAAIDCVKEKKNPSGRPAKGLYEAFFKRMLDFMCGCAAVIVFWPIYLAVAILVKIKHGSPVIFGQERPGKDEKIFKLYKFRSMTNERDENGELLPDEQRLTRFGKLLRATSLDELPEAFNIIKGDMSVIGPRPLLVKYLPLYNEEQKHRHDVRPGLSGYAQAHGRNAVTWEDKFAMDVWYTNHISFFGDVKIIWDTVMAVLKRDGISSGTSVTMEEFKGTPAEQERQ